MPQPRLLASPELQGTGGCRAGWAWGRDAEGSLRGKRPRPRFLILGVLGAGWGVCRHWVKGGCPAGSWGKGRAVVSLVDGRRHLCPTTPTLHIHPPGCWGLGLG